MESHTAVTDCMDFEVTTSLSNALENPSLHSGPERRLFVASMCVCLAVLPGNILTIIAFMNDRAARVAANYLIINQSAVDVLTALTYTVFAFLSYEPTGKAILNQSRSLCLLTTLSIAFLLASSSLNILAISVQRLIFVVYPQTSKSRRLAAVTLVAVAAEYALMAVLFCMTLLSQTTWYPGVSCNLLVVYNSFYHLTLLALIPTLLIIGVTGSNAYLCFRYKKQMRSIAPSHPSDQQKAKEWRVTMMLVVVAALFLVGWLPLGLTVLIVKNNTDLKTGISFVWELETARIFLLVNGIANPVIYAAKIPTFKNAFKKLFRIKQRT